MRRHCHTRLSCAGLATLVATVAACRGDHIIEDRTATYPVVGRVTGPAGAPVRGATVTVWAYSAPDCAGLLSGGGQATTDAAGRYAAGFGSWLGTFDGCVEARVTPPTGTAAAGVVRGAVVHLDYTRRDSAVVDVRLAARVAAHPTR